MSIRWKIFRIANLIEILLIVLLTSLGLYKNNFSSGYQNDVSILLFFFAVVLVILINCTNNLWMLRDFTAGYASGTERKILFWCLFLLFLFVIVLIISALAVETPDIIRQSSTHQPIDRGLLILLISMLVLGLAGIYVLFMQAVLFFRMRRNSGISKTLLVTQIGKDMD